MILRKVPHGLRVDNVLITRHHADYLRYLQLWETRQNLQARRRLQKHRAKKIIPDTPNRMRYQNQSVNKLMASSVKTRKTREGSTVYDPVRRMWVTFTDPEKATSFWTRLSQREEGKLGL